MIPAGAKVMMRVDIFPEAAFGEWIGRCGITRSACLRTSTALAPELITLVVEPVLLVLRAIRGLNVAPHLAYEATGANLILDNWHWSCNA